MTAAGNATVRPLPFLGDCRAPRRRPYAFEVKARADRVVPLRRPRQAGVDFAAGEHVGRWGNADHFWLDVAGGLEDLTI